MGLPVHVGGITVIPGDLLYGDSNGVTTIPTEIADEVPQACEEYAACEAVVLNYLGQPGATREGLAQAQSECKSMMGEFGKRVSRA